MAIQTNTRLVKLAISVVSVAAIAGISGSLANQADRAPAVPDASLVGGQPPEYDRGDSRSRLDDRRVWGDWDEEDDLEHDRKDGGRRAELLFGERAFGQGRRTRTRFS